MHQFVEVVVFPESSVMLERIIAMRLAGRQAEFSTISDAKGDFINVDNVEGAAAPGAYGKPRV